MTKGTLLFYGRSRKNERRCIIEDIEPEYDVWKFPDFEGNFPMSVGHGEIVGVVGESGSGKSTVIYSAMGLLGKGGRVASGEIRYKTQDLLKISAEELRRLRGEKMTLIAQNPMDSFPPIRKTGRNCDCL